MRTFGGKSIRQTGRAAVNRSCIERWGSFLGSATKQDPWSGWSTQSSKVFPCVFQSLPFVLLAVFLSVSSASVCYSRCSCSIPRGKHICLLRKRGGAGELNGMTERVGKPWGKRGGSLGEAGGKRGGSHKNHSGFYRSVGGKRVRPVWPCIILEGGK